MSCSGSPGHTLRKLQSKGRREFIVTSAAGLALLYGLGKVPLSAKLPRHKRGDKSEVIIKNGWVLLRGDV